MLVGWAGQVSLGHFAVVGLAAYLTARWADNWSLAAIVVVAGLIGAAVMAAVGLPALRVGGLALAVTTMGFAVVSADWLLRQSWVGSSGTFATVAHMRLGLHLGSQGSPLSLYHLAPAMLALGAVSAGAMQRWGPARLARAGRG